MPLPLLLLTQEGMRVALDTFTPYLRDRVIRAPVTPLFVALLLLLFLLPGCAIASVTIMVLLGSDLVPHTTHLV